MPAGVPAFQKERKEEKKRGEEDGQTSSLLCMPVTENSTHSAMFTA